MRTGSVISLVVVLALAVAGCGGDDGDPTGVADPVTSSTPVPTPSPSASASSTPTPSATPTPVPKIDCTRLLGQSDAEALAAEGLGAGKAESVVAGLPGCRWESSSSGSWVLAVAVPARVWAAAVPEAIDAALQSGIEFEGRDKLEDARRLIEEGNALDDAAACGIFSTMLSALQGQPAGTKKVINYLPDRESAQGINEQACLAGRYYSVQLITTALKPGPALEKRVQQALARLSR